MSDELDSDDDEASENCGSFQNDDFHYANSGDNDSIRDSAVLDADQASFTLPEAATLNETHNNEDSSNAHRDSSDEDSDSGDASESHESCDADCDFIFDTSRVNGSAIMFPAAKLTVSDVLLMIQTYSVTAECTKKDEQNLLEFVKILAGPEWAEWKPPSNYYLSKIYDLPKDKIKLHFYCTTCHTIVDSRPGSKPIKTGEEVMCPNCETASKIASNVPNKFMTVDARYQLQSLLNDPAIQDDLMKNLENIKKSNSEEDMNEGIIGDVWDGELWKIAQMNNPGTVTYNINADGATYTVSGNTNLWPAQFHINELSPKIRFSNIILVGLFLTTSEPTADCLNLFFKAIFDELRDLKEKGLNVTLHATGEKVNLKFTCLLLPFDTIARPLLQNRLQFNGYYGCSWCYDPGVHINNIVRYPLTAESTIRTHEGHQHDAQEAERSGRTIRGVKGPSIMQNEEHIDLVWSFPPEYQHGILLGVVKTLWRVWRKQGFLKARDYAKINERFLKIKRPHEIHRLPRSVTNTSKWKATEWKSWLLYDSVPCLEGILDDACLQSYMLLVKSMFILLKPSTTSDERDLCEMQLLQFVGEYEQLYGKGAITFGVHLLLHLVEAVKRCGPLWAFSTFPFENAIYYFKQKVHSPKGVDHQIANLYVKKEIIKRNIDNNTNNELCQNFCYSLFSTPGVQLYSRADNGVVLVGSGKVKKELQTFLMNHFDDCDTPIKTFEKCICRDMVARSVDYTRPTRHDDSIFHLKDQRIVQIHNIIEVNNKCYVHCRELTVSPYKINPFALEHLFKVEIYKTEDILVDADELMSKMAHFNVEESTFVSFLPNTHEIQ